MLQNRVIAYASPAHTTETTQISDLTFHPSFMSHYRQLGKLIVKSHLYGGTFPIKFQAAFYHSGKLPTFYHGENLSRISCRRNYCTVRTYFVQTCMSSNDSSSDNAFLCCLLDYMVAQLSQLRKQCGIYILDEHEVLSGGFLNTFYGAMVTNETAHQILCSHGEECQ